MMMKFPRRKFLHLAASAAALPAVSRIANAQTYPARPIHLIVGFAAGGAMDVNARLMGQWLSERLGQQFVIENRTGAGGNIATEAVVRASPDGYTLLTCGTANAVNASLYVKLDFNFIRDIAPVAGLVRLPLVLIVHPSVPPKTAAEFIAYAKANAGKVYYASPGSGTSVMMSAELFRIMTNIPLPGVTYRGLNGGGYTDMISGRVQITFDNLPGSIGYIRNGQFGALGVTTKARSDQLPDVPSISDAVPGYEASAFYGLNAAKGTPPEIVDKLNKAVNAGLADPVMKGKLANLGGMMMPGTPGEFGKMLAAETDKWAKVIREANIKLMD